VRAGLRLFRLPRGSTTLDIRAERPADAVAISELTTSAFKNTAHGSGTEALIVERLRAAEVLAVSLVAAEDSDIVGHVACSPVTIDPDQGRWYGLGPVSVRPDRQRLGIGQALVRAALDNLRSLRAAGCVLLGDPAYYQRFGFVSEAALTYRGVRSRYFQSLLLGGPAAMGDVSFHPSFDD
jgi:putative acetyltransferase